MEPLSLQNCYAGKRILLTGASGFVGKVWLAMMLAKFPELGKCYVLIRPKKTLSAVERFEELLGRSPAFRPLHQQWGEGLNDFLRDRLEVLEGDVSMPNLGLAPELSRRLHSEVDLIVHCAGLVDFEPDLREAVAANVNGTMHALAFAKSCRRAAFLHVSTAFVCGRTRGEFVAETLKRNFVPNGADYDVEAEYREVLQQTQTEEKRRDWVEQGQERARRWGWPNAYTYTKSMAESLILNRAGDLPYAILRPSIVESALDFPFPGWNEGAETCTPISYLAGSWLRHITARPKLTLDIVPVDTVCRGIAVAGAALLAGRHRPVYHCASSYRNALSVGRMLELIDLAHRIHYREHGTSPLERLLLSRWDAVAVTEQSPFAVDKLKELATQLSAATKKWEAKASDRVKAWIHPLTVFANQSKWTLIKAEKIIQVFLPFIYENNFRFVTENLAAHRVVESEFQFRPEAIDWRDYILNIHEPGVRRWCYPILESKPVETDAHPYAVRLAREPKAISEPRVSGRAR
ncbi:MAG: fatty acyl-CoA reductase [bacterium]